jgi:HlyD family secretion protein
VSRLNSQLGERVVGTAMMAGTEIMIVADLNDMEARVDIGEIDVVLIALGQNARLEVDAFKDRKFIGIVTEIANSSKGASSGSGGQSQEATKFEVRIRIQEKEQFRPGMSVTAEIETRSKTNVISVPIASVTTRLPKVEKDEKGGKKGKEAGTNDTGKVTAQSTNAVGKTNLSQTGVTSTNTVGGKKGAEGPKPMEVVFLKEGDRAKMVPVKRGISDDSYVEITEGLSEGQEVVSGGYKAISRELEDGKKVVIGTAKLEATPDKEKK